MTIAEILDYLKQRKIRFEFSGDAHIEFYSFCPLNDLKDYSITWVRNIIDIPIDKMNAMKHTVLVAEIGHNLSAVDFPVIYVENVKRTYFRIIDYFFSSMNPNNCEGKIESSAVVETCHIGDNVYIGHGTYVGPDVILGSGVKIFQNVSIRGKVVIGDNTIIESGAVIGACGFGYYKDEEGNPVCVPHDAGIKVGKYVVIGANTAIARGCLGDTIIEDYVKIDNLCHIAHNVHIKKGAMLAAGAIVSGSTEVGENVWLAPGTVLNNAIVVGDNSYLGLGTIATKDIQEGKVAVGVPARIIRDNTANK